MGFLLSRRWVAVRARRRGAGVRHVVARRVAVPPPGRPQGRERRRTRQRAPRAGPRGRRAEPGRRPVRPRTSGGWSARPGPTTRRDVVVRYRNRDGVQGVDVVVPLVTATGTALLVDRGWLETDPSGADRDDIPDPPAGEVDGDRLRPGQRHRRQHPGRRPVRPARSAATRSARRSATRSTAASWSCRSEDPEPDTALEPVELPELEQRPALLLRPAVVVLRACWRSSASATCSTTSGGTARAASVPDRGQSKARLRPRRRAQIEREKPEHARRRRAASRRRRTTPPARAGRPRPGRTPPARRSGPAGSSRSRPPGGLGVAGGRVQLGDPLGADPAGQQPVDPDAARAELVGQRLGDHRQPGRSPLETARLGSGCAHARGEHEGDRAALAAARAADLTASRTAPRNTASNAAATARR